MSVFAGNVCQVLSAPGSACGAIPTGYPAPHIQFKCPSLERGHPVVPVQLPKDAIRTPDVELGPVDGGERRRTALLHRAQFHDAATHSPRSLDRRLKTDYRVLDAELTTDSAYISSLIDH